MINVDLKDHIQKGFTFSIKPQENSGDPPEIEKEANPPRIQRDTSSCETNTKDNGERITVKQK